MTHIIGDARKHLTIEISASEGSETWSFELHVFSEDSSTVVKWEVKVPEGELGTGKVPDQVAQELDGWLVTEGAVELFQPALEWLEQQRIHHDWHVRRNASSRS